MKRKYRQQMWEAIGKPELPFIHTSSESSRQTRKYVNRLSNFFLQSGMGDRKIIVQTPKKKK